MSKPAKQKYKMTNRKPYNQAHKMAYVHMGQHLALQLGETGTTQRASLVDAEVQPERHRSGRAKGQHPRHDRASTEKIIAGSDRQVLGHMAALGFDPTADQIQARIDYLLHDARRIGALKSRDLANHSPINYVRALFD